MTRLLPFSLFVFIVSAFALPTEAAYSLVFYVCVMPLALLAPCSGWKMRPSGVWLAQAVILWSGLTLLWGETTGDRDLHFLLATAATAAFVLALSTVLRDPASRYRLAMLLVCAAAANAAFVLLLNAPALLRGGRVLGWGVTRQPILGGSVMAAACLTALWRCKTPLTAAASLLMAGFVLAMQSRGALLGLAGGATVIALTRMRRRSLAATGAIAALVWLALPQFAANLLERGTSHRLEIWSQTWSLIQERPLFGHGLAANLPFSPTGFPHSLYLSLLFYSGAIGLGLFAALGVWVTLRLFRAVGPERSWVAALWVNALLAGLTDFGQVTKGPGPLWFILWLPILLALTLPATPPAAAAALPSAAR
jgi:O-antigen ligase